MRGWKGPTRKNIHTVATSGGTLLRMSLTSHCGQVSTVHRLNLCSPLYNCWGWTNVCYRLSKCQKQIRFFYGRSWVVLHACLVYSLYLKERSRDRQAPSGNLRRIQTKHSCASLAPLANYRRCHSPNYHLTHSRLNCRPPPAPAQLPSYRTLRQLLSCSYAYSYPSLH